MIRLRSAIHAAPQATSTLSDEPAPAAPPPDAAKPWYASWTALDWGVLAGGVVLAYWILTMPAGGGGGGKEATVRVALQGSDRQMQRVEKWAEDNGLDIAETGTDTRSGQRDVAIDTYGSRSNANALARRVKRRYRGVRARVYGLDPY